MYYLLFFSVESDIVFKPIKIVVLVMLFLNALVSITYCEMVMIILNDFIDGPGLFIRMLGYVAMFISINPLLPTLSYALTRLGLSMLDTMTIKYNSRVADQSVHDILKTGKEMVDIFRLSSQVFGLPISIELAITMILQVELLQLMLEHVFIC